MQHAHCVKSVRIRSHCGPYFPAFGLNTERYRVPLRIQSECKKIAPEQLRYGHYSRSGRDYPDFDVH